MDRRLAREISILVAILAGLLWWLTGWLRPIVGYGIGLAIYWGLILLPLTLWKLGPSGLRHILVPGRPGPGLLLVAALPVVALWAAALWTGAFAALPALAIGMVVGGGIVNGTLEEAFWRGALIDRTDQPNQIGAALLLFTGWHVALLAARGISLTGGALGLIGGAFLLGLILMACRLRTGTAGFGALIHAGFNIPAFAMLAADNIG